MDDVGGPVFVKIEEYKEVLDILDAVKIKLGDVRKTLIDINKLKDEEDRELSAWSKNVDDIANKIDGIDKAVFGKR